MFITFIQPLMHDILVTSYGISVHQFSSTTIAESTEETKKRSNTIVEMKGSGAHRQKVAAQAA
jgi:hypothetical protein